MSDYHMHGYLFTPTGFHGPPAIIATRDELSTFLRIWGAIALQMRLEYLITSGDDLMAQAIRGGTMPQTPERAP